MSTLSQLLLRTLSGSPTRAFRSVEGGAIFFGTDVGLRREDNQDRVAVARWRPRGRKDGASILAVIVSDGMGGLQDGAFCASQAIAVFLAKLIEADSLNMRIGAQDAVHAANDSVFSRYRGKGGATFSAVLISTDLVLGVNVGDSRIYSPTRQRPDISVRRLTTDDTMKEAFGSEGSGLLQYIGAGPDLRPHVFEVGSSDFAVITTDGAHFVNQQVFLEILARSPDPKAVVERCIALSRWLGAPDNTTVAAVDIQRALSMLAEDRFGYSEFWTGGMDGPLYVAETNAGAPDNVATSQSSAVVDKGGSSLQVPSTVNQAAAPQKQATKTKRRKRVAPNGPNRLPVEQLTIDVEVTKDATADADR